MARTRHVRGSCRSPGRNFRSERLRNAPYTRLKGQREREVRLLRRGREAPWMTERLGPRLVVGISRSRASWWALAWAVGESRRRGMRLLLVTVVRPSAVPVANIDQDPSGPPRDPFADEMAYGHALIRTAIDQAVGPDARRRAGQAAGGLRTGRRGACQTCPRRRPAGARMPTPRMAAPARARIGSAGLRAANGVPGRDRARTVAAGTFGALGDRLLPRPLVSLDAAARSTCSVVTIACKHVRPGGPPDMLGAMGADRRQAPDATAPLSTGNPGQTRWRAGPKAAGPWAPGSRAVARRPAPSAAHPGRRPRPGSAPGAGRPASPDPWPGAPAPPGRPAGSFPGPASRHLPRGSASARAGGSWASSDISRSGGRRRLAASVARSSTVLAAARRR